jgi:hypothetical protein
MKGDCLENHRIQWKTCPGPYKTIEYIEICPNKLQNHECILHTSQFQTYYIKT